MDWQQYEKEIETQFREAYPSSRITSNAKLIGKFSKVERQIDLLIEEQASDFAFRIVVDAKYRGRKIDVGDVEAFLGLTQDVEAHTGMMIALEGFTPAAINRAHYDNLDVVLDVLSLDDLKAFQGPTAIPYSGNCGAWIVAPLGWVVDATRREGMLATLYQRGLTFEEAMRNQEFMYINFWKKPDDDGINTLDALLKHQEGYMLSDSSDTEIHLLDGVQNQRVGAKSLIRRFKKKTYPTPEYTGFVDFENFIFMCVLFTPEQLEKKNLRKLRFVMRDLFPMTITRDNTGVIRAAEAKLKEAAGIEERAKLLAQIGWWYRDMDRLVEARQSLEESLSLVPGYYDAIKQLLATLAKLGDKEALLEQMGRLLRLDPRNPTVFDDCIIYAKGTAVGWSDLIKLLESLGADNTRDKLVLANCDFYAGKILLIVDPSSASSKLVAARDAFRTIFPQDHQVFAALRESLEQASKAERASGPA